MIRNALSTLMVLLFSVSTLHADVLVVDSATYSTYSPANNNIATFSVGIGDVIAVMGSGNNSEIRTSSNLELSGTAGLAWTDEGNASAGAAVQYWYGTAMSSGTVTLDYGHDASGHIAIGVYQLRSDAAKSIKLLTDPVLLESANDAAISSLDLVYNFGTVIAQGVYVEGYASYNVFSTKAIANDIERVGKFGVGDGVFTSTSGFTSSYVIPDDDSNQIVLGGMAFTEDAPVGNRASEFDSDPVAAPSVSPDTSCNASLTDYATDLDDDTMTFWAEGGPVWLNVASNGALTGTSPSTEGLNSWTVYVTDGKGVTNSATLEINVAIPQFVEVPLTSANLYVQGAKYLDIDANGMNFHRFDFDNTYSNVSPVKAKTTSGVKLTLYTRSDTVKLTFDYGVGDEYRNSSKFTTYQNGTYVSTPAHVSLENPVSSAIPFVVELVSASAPGELVRHDVVFPNWANPILSKVEVKAGEVLEAGNPFENKQVVFLGDSISHGTGQSTTAAGYPYQVAEALDMELFNLAVGGGKMAPDVADLLEDFDPVEAIWILIGYNDWQGGKTVSELTADYEALLSTVRLRQPDAEIFCCTLVATTVVDDPGSGVTAGDVRQAVSDVVNARIAAGDEQLYLVDGDSISSSDASYTMNTTVHFTELGAADFATNVVAIMEPVVSDPKPNVLFIAIDDMNPIVSAYGNDLIQTPNMDRLATRGTTFLNAHCQWAVCGPSRASLMTGLMPEQTGVMGFNKMRGLSANGERDNTRGVTNVVTIPQHFIDYGYTTAATGKINDYRCVGSMNPDGTINEDGGSVDDPLSWSHQFQNSGGSVSSSKAYNAVLDKDLTLASESVNQPASNFTDGVAATKGIEMMNALATNQPFFLGVGFKKPHLPFLSPKSSWDLYDRNDFIPHPFPYEMANATGYSLNSITEMRSNYYLETDGGGDALKITSGILPEDQQKLLLHGYYACISHVDEQVGRILDELDILGLSSNTVIVLWGDHGFHLGDHNEWGKHTNLEQATRVPFIISAPGYAQGKTSTTPVGLLDIFPTLCDLAGLPEPVQPPNSVDPLPRPLSGRSLVPVITDDSAEVQTGIVSHYGSGNYGYAYRTDRYRYMEWIGSSGNVITNELYDYQQDPMETINLAGEPGFEGLAYQFSISMRDSSEARGCDRLKASTPPAAPANKTLGGLELDNGQIAWPEAVGVTYSLLSSSNLTDSVWTIRQTGITAPVPMPTEKWQEFFKIEVAE
ncbi:sulfatase-like hydrolase/transferase [Pontiella sulfatireligans]|uniref:Arylsulfatase n=1 Tax=Pontiella sulfatireligans TaxID=2750658 RepID=A0A6C2UGG0_9BACT|nr:sulfatase-like hydrolase/transferase [Pontiella sulfatireligans]SPS74297.1 sulfatase S1_7 [Kiritimatiellales bacterium]VGO19218.1 Arylsulfatase [Pontiella sulfatireligans]